MNRSELIEEIREVLTNAGFYVSKLFSMRPVSFDLIARRDNSLLIIKVLTNIDALSDEVAQELKLLSKLLKGNSILVGERSSTAILENEVVYDRCGIQAVNSETLKNLFLEGNPLKIYAGPGGFYVNINTERLIKLRHDLNISLGSFARSVSVSRRTVRLYEEGMNARVEIAERMEELLGTSITMPIDILSFTTSKIEELKNLDFGKEKIIELQREIFYLLKELGYKIIPMERCPFEAVSKDRDEILLTCVHQYDDKLIKKAKIVSSISKITEKHAVVFVDKEVNKTNIEGTPVINKKELRRSKDPEDLLELIIERICS
ncbi:MAG: transcriptional regulator [Candidatus Thermoplasmatota archaeon]|nr:transcriptional regulator [Candidatus Thermoplasmatota archaeon]